MSESFEGPANGILKECSLCHKEFPEILIKGVQLNGSSELKENEKVSEVCPICVVGIARGVTKNPSFKFPKGSIEARAVSHASMWLRLQAEIVKKAKKVEGEIRQLKLVTGEVDGK